MADSELVNRKVYGIVVLGGGILGTSLAYWLSQLYEGEDIAVLEMEQDVARHMSGRNTGVVHRPFYLHPEKRPVFAKSALISHKLWKVYAEEKRLPWSDVGTLEIASEDCEEGQLLKYAEWAVKNGMSCSECEFFSGVKLKQLEPNVSARAGLLCRTDAAVDFAAFAKALRKDAEDNGVSFLLGEKLIDVDEEADSAVLICKSGRKVYARYVINCMGGGALRTANLFGAGKEFASLSVRGEYWAVRPEFRNFTKYSIYSVPRYPKYPFLDPHWVIRCNDRVDVGPNAVPVLEPYAYEGMWSSARDALPYLFLEPFLNKLKLFGNSEFRALARNEWRGSFSEKLMLERVKRFLPGLPDDALLGPGIAGVRNVIIDRSGELQSEAIELCGARSFHILNYNSPGATGAPAYAAYCTKKLMEMGVFADLKQRNSAMGVWNFEEVCSKL